jgi:hypothetical protein
MAYYAFIHIVAKTCFMGKRRLKKEISNCFNFRICSWYCAFQSKRRISQCRWERQVLFKTVNTITWGVFVWQWVLEGGGPVGLRQLAQVMLKLTTYWMLSESTTIELLWPIRSIIEWVTVIILDWDWNDHLLPV